MFRLSDFGFRFSPCAACAFATVFVTILFAAARIPAADFSAWAHRQTVTLPQPGLVKLALSAETLAAARPAQEDLRIAGPDGSEVSSAILRPMVRGQETRKPRSLRVELNSGFTLAQVETGVGESLDGVTLQTPARNFLKAVNVEGSTDGVAWQPLASGQPIFRRSTGEEQLTVPLPIGARRLLRLTLNDATSEPLPLTGADLRLAATEPPSTEPVPVRIVERLETPGESRLTLDLGAANLDLHALALETPEPLFHRALTLKAREAGDDGVIREKTLAQDTLFRTRVAGQPTQERVEMPLRLRTPARELLLVIENADSPPLKLDAVRARRLPVWIVFAAARAGNHALLVGNRDCPAPHYDLPAAADLQDIAPAALTFSPLAPNPDHRPGEALPDVSDLGAELDTAEWTFRKPVQIERVGVVQLELDLEVLSHAEPSLADLRLVRGGRQLPYLVERTGLLRTIQPAVAPAPDPAEPKLSRWKITLPQPRIPLTRLACTSPTALFRREVALYEEPADERGAKYRRSLGSAAWSQSPGAERKTLLLTLSQSPITDTLLLETDNGDNPAIELRGIELAFPVTHLLFKCGATDGVFLYYGQPKASAPRYDLKLVAGQMLAAPRDPAPLGREERLKEAGWAERHAGARGGPLLWVVLGLVVVILLLLIARLVPRH